MATLLQLKQGDSGTTLNLNSSSSTGFRLDENGWNPAVATPVYMGDPPPVLERLDLLLSNTNYDNLASNMQSLHEMQVLADRYINDPTQENPVWLHAQMDGETGERRALVRRITVQYKAPWFGAGKSTTNIPLVITVVRGPYWENPTAMPLPDVAPSAAACVVYDYTSGAGENIVGDVGARIRYFTLYDNGSDKLARYWMGIRSANKHGADGITNFVNIWECEDGIGHTDVTDEIDSTASGGYRIQAQDGGTVTWSSSTLQKVFTHKLTTASANEEDQFGNFLWLCRAKVTTGTWEIQIRFYNGPITEPGNVIKGDIIEVANTSWQNKEMGIMPIGLINRHAILESDYSKANEGAYRVVIYARRTSGATTTDLHLDCLIPMPIDEGFIKAEHSTNYATLYYSLGQSPEGVWDVFGHAASAVYDQGSIESIENFVLPYGDGRIYCVYERDASSDITDTVVFNDSDLGKYYERWLSLRGSE